MGNGNKWSNILPKVLASEEKAITGRYVGESRCVDG